MSVNRNLTAPYYWYHGMCASVYTIIASALCFKERYFDRTAKRYVDITSVRDNQNQLTTINMH